MARKLVVEKKSPLTILFVGFWQNHVAAHELSARRRPRPSSRCLLLRERRRQSGRKEGRSLGDSNNLKGMIQSEWERNLLHSLSQYTEDVRGIYRLGSAIFLSSVHTLCPPYFSILLSKKGCTVKAK